MVRCGTLGLLFSACTTASPVAGVPTPTPLATFTNNQETALFCADLDAAWPLADWPRVIKDLEAVQRVGGGCGGQAASLQLYPAWYNYGAALEAGGDLPGAIDAYRHALIAKPDGREAGVALRKHDALTPEPFAACPPEQIATASAVLPAYQPSMSGGFVVANGVTFTLDGAPFTVHGVNYYPPEAPWHRFLTDTTPAILRRDLDLIAGAGFNTIRVFVAYDALFMCPGSGAIPKADSFARLDSVIQLAAERHLHVLVTLNDLPDLTFHPLYTEPAIPASQTAFIVARYRDEPAIVGWDVRNEGDVDYIRGYASAAAVSTWLQATTAAVRAIDPHHLITAGWNEGSAATVSAVDFVSFHHWRTADDLHARIGGLRNNTGAPIVLEEVGYSTLVAGEAIQTEDLRVVLDTADADGLAGWIVWMAFDTTPGAACVPPDCPGHDNPEFHFGLWRVDGTPKAALVMLRDRITASH